MVNRVPSPRCGSSRGSFLRAIRRYASRWRGPARYRPVRWSAPCPHGRTVRRAEGGAPPRSPARRRPPRAGRSSLDLPGNGDPPSLLPVFYRVVHEVRDGERQMSGGRPGTSPSPGAISSVFPACWRPDGAGPRSGRGRRRWRLPPFRGSPRRTRHATARAGRRSAAPSGGRWSGRVEERRVGVLPFPQRVLDRLEIPPDIRQGCPQFVGGVGDEVALDLGEPPLLGDVPEGDEDVASRFPRDTARLSRNTDRPASLGAYGTAMSLGFGSSPFIHPSMKAGPGEGGPPRGRDGLPPSSSRRRGPSPPPVHHPYGPVRGDDDHPVVEAGEQRLEAGLPRIELADRLRELCRHPVHRVRHVLELVPGPDLHGPARLPAPISSRPPSSPPADR